MMTVTIRRLPAPLALFALLTLAPSVQADEIVADAVTGKPYGIARITLNTKEKVELVDDIRSLQIRERAGRALYSIVSMEDRVLTAVKRTEANTVTVHFLFRGEEPLDVELLLRNGRRETVFLKPKSDEEQHKELLDEWWKLRERRAQVEWRRSELSEGIERYALAMLARRLDRPNPRTGRDWRFVDGTDMIVGLLAGTDSIRAAMQSRKFLRGTTRTEELVHDLPKGVDIPAVPVPEVPDDVVIEPIAMHVPDDCFYLRCGSFQNFLWLRSNVELWGARFRDLSIGRPVDQGIRNKLEQQFALKETAVARLFGKAVISDVALIGADTFFREGAAVGIVFEAKNSTLLAAQITAQRAQAMATVEGASEETIDFDGHPIRFLSTPDNRVRSFYVADGDYHLVTNSRTIANDFIRAGRGKNALGQSKEFRHSRDLMPAGPEQTAFVYMPDPFFRRLVSPQYRVEMTRRTFALSEIETLQYARLAARAEKQPHETIEQLIEGGFLEEQFQTRPDGSHVVGADNELRDSLRGAHGCFLPVPDVAIERITPSELNKYQQFTRQYRAMWTRVDPVTIGVSRKVVGADRERVVFDVHITPVMKQRVGFLQQFLARPDKQMMKPVDDDFAGVQFLLNARAISGPNQPEGPTHRVFAGLREVELGFRIENGEVQHNQVPNLEPFYVGSTPAIFLFGGKAEQADEDGYYQQQQRGFAGLGWGRKFDDFHVRASARRMLEEVTPQLKVVPAERPAQVRLWIGDPKETPWAPMFTAVGYTETRQLSSRGAQYLNRLTDNFAIEADEALVIGESLLHAKLFCPLGGRYQLASRPDGFADWKSTGWKTESRRHINSVPEGYRFPFLDWFHSLDIEFNVDATTLRTRLQLETSRTALPGRSS